MNYSDTTVIIPALDEEENIERILKEIKRYNKINIIVVDDGSKDKTVKIAKRHAKVIDRSKAKIKGLTASVLEGIKITDTRFLVVIDADFQHPPEKIKEIIQKLRQGKDIVIGTRRNIKDWKLSRRVISKTATALGNLRLSLSGNVVQDPMSGFFGIGTKLAKQISKEAFEKEGYKILFDFLKYAGKKDIAAVPYTFEKRKKGISKIRIRHILSFIRSLLK